MPCGSARTRSTGSSQILATQPNLASLRKVGEVTAIIQYEKVRDGFNQSGHQCGGPCATEGKVPELLRGTEQVSQTSGQQSCQFGQNGPDTGNGWMEVMQNLERTSAALLDAGWRGWLLE